MTLRPYQPAEPEPDHNDRDSDRDDDPPGPALRRGECRARRIVDLARRRDDFVGHRQHFTAVHVDNGERWTELVDRLDPRVEGLGIGFDLLAELFQEHGRCDFFGRAVNLVERIVEILELFEEQVAGILPLVEPVVRLMTPHDQERE